MSITPAGAAAACALPALLLLIGLWWCIASLYEERRTRQRTEIERKHLKDRVDTLRTTLLTRSSTLTLLPVLPGSGADHEDLAVDMRIEDLSREAANYANKSSSRGNEMASRNGTLHADIAQRA